MTVDTDVLILINQLDNNDLDVRQAAKQALIHIGEPAIEALIEAMYALRGKRCWEAASILAQIGTPAAQQAVSQMLTSPNIMVSQIAASAVARWGMTDVLLTALPETHGMVQLKIVDGLEKIADPRAVTPLRVLLRTTDSPALRTASIQALGVIGSPELIPDIEPYLEDTDHHVRKRASVALERLRSLPKPSEPS